MCSCKLTGPRCGRLWALHLARRVGSSSVGARTWPRFCRAPKATPMIQFSLASRMLALLAVIGFLASCAGSSGTGTPSAGLVPAAQSKSVPRGESRQGDASQIAVAPNSLTFSVGGAPQTFTVTGEDSRDITARSSNTSCATVSAATTKPPKRDDEERDTRHHEGDDGGSGATFTVTPVGPGTCTITVTGKQGKDDNATVAVNVVGSLVEFAYAVNLSSNTISAYAVNATSGALTPVPGSPFATGTNPDSIAVDPSGKFAYVTTIGEPSSPSVFIYAYTINASSGALTPVAGSPFSGGPNPTAVTVDPTGTFAFVTNQGNNTISAFRINAASGALAPVVGSPYAVGTSPQGVAATSKFAYVTNIADGTVSAFAIDGTSGALTPVPGSPFAAGQGPGVAVDPAGKFAYATNVSDSTVSGSAINATSGALTPVPGSPFGTGNAPAGIAVDPTGRFAFVADLGSNAVSAYTISATSGALTPVAGSPFGSGAAPVAVAADPAGKFAYAAGLSGVSAYTIDATSGALTPVAGSPFVAGLTPDGIAVARPH